MNVYYATRLEISMKRLKNKRKSILLLSTFEKKKKKLQCWNCKNKKKEITFPALTLQKESPFNVLFKLE